MPTKYRFQKQIANNYLHTFMIVKGMTRTEVEYKAQQQLARWAQQEASQRASYQVKMTRQAQQDRLQMLMQQADWDNAEAQKRNTQLRDLLLNGLKVNHHFSWEQLKQHRQFPPFPFNDQPPNYDQIARSLGVPAPQPRLEAIFSGKKKYREELEAKAQQTLAFLSMQYDRKRTEAIQAYEQQKNTFEAAQNEYNASIERRHIDFEQGKTEAVTDAIKRTMDDLGLPEDYGKDYDIDFNEQGKIAVISMQLPTLAEVPKITGYKFIKTRQAIEPVEMKDKDFEVFYDSLLYQIALLTMYRIFREAYTPALQSLVFNGYVTNIDRATGKDLTACVITVQASRETFQALNLERVDPKECFRSLKGLVAGPLAQLAPVRPILEFNREDKRFIESHEILANLGAADNLAEMDWEDFEHLVRELFEKEFGGEGAEVRVTQASRDQGVDAIAFDPDPIRGGKFVIQAKRYNIVVPVSAVRDLYGTVMNEHASRGILVTTSHYGNDSYEFAKDKQITLIDGSNLVHMFQKHGYDVRIDLKSKKDNS